MREVARENKREEKTWPEKPSPKTKGKISKRTEGGWHERTQKIKERNLGGKTIQKIKSGRQKINGERAKN